jgi:hypothetical protein
MIDTEHCEKARSGTDGGHDWRVCKEFDMRWVGTVRQLLCSQCFAVYTIVVRTPSIQERGADLNDFDTDELQAGIRSYFQNHATMEHWEELSASALVTLENGDFSPTLDYAILQECIALRKTNNAV